MTDGGRASRTGRPHAVRVEEVTKAYGRFTAVDAVTFTIEPGATVGLFGPNGAGKTTLLRMLAGLTRPTSGSIHVGASEQSPDDHDVARRLGVVTHEPMVYDELTARENLRFHATLHGVDDPADRAESVLETVSLDHRGSHRPSAFSHGLRKRLSLARALLHDPEVLLLDEPYAGLDQRSVADLAAVLDGFDDRTVVLTTHDLQRGYERCSRALVLDRGRLQTDLELGSETSEAFETAYYRALGLEGRRRGESA